MSTMNSIGINTGASNTILQGQGVGTALAFSTATYPATTTINQILYSSAANTVSGLATANSAVLVTGSTGVPVMSSTMTNGQVIIGSTGATPTAAALTAGTGITITNGAGSITIGNTVASAPASATYILQTANGSLTNAQALGALATGILKSTTTTGVVSIAAAGTDYYSPGNPLYLSGSPHASNSNALGTTENINIASLGSNNVGFGSGIFTALSTGTRNTGFGSGVLAALSTQTRNTCFGYTAGAALAANANCAFGDSALSAAITSDDNNAFGYVALQNLTGASASNNAFGTASFQTMTGGSNNCGFGNNSGQSKTLYNSCTFIGDSTDASVNNLTNATAIGASATVGQSNSIVLGHLANVGIGTSTPNTSALLELASTTQSLLIPRMTTTQKNALTAVAGMMVYDSSLGIFSNYNGAWSQVSYPNTTTINQILYSSAANTVSGLATANSSVLVTGSTGVPVMSSTMTNGQVIIGSTGATPTAAALTAGTGITITNGAGTITVASNGTPQAIVDQNSSTVTMAVNTVYIIDNGASLVTLTLNATAALGSTFEIVGFSAGGWTIAQNSGQTIHFNTTSTTTGATGTLSSTVQYNCVKLRCSKANTDFTVVESQGNLTVV